MRKMIIIHNTGGTDKNPDADSSNFTFEQCNELHKERFDYKSSLGFYCGYHYYIEKSGKVTQARLDSEMGAHTVGYNDCIGICLAGNFDIGFPTDEQKKSLKELLLKLTMTYGIKPYNVYPHRKFANKTCYGKYLSDTWGEIMCRMAYKEAELSLWQKVAVLMKQL